MHLLLPIYKHGWLLGSAVCGSPIFNHLIPVGVIRNYVGNVNLKVVQNMRIYKPRLKKIIHCCDIAWTGLHYVKLCSRQSLSNKGIASRSVWQLSYDYRRFPTSLECHWSRSMTLIDQGFLYLFWFQQYGVT